MCVFGSGMNHSSLQHVRQEGSGQCEDWTLRLSMLWHWFEEDRGFWGADENNFFDTMAKLYQVLQTHHVSYELFQR